MLKSITQASFNKKVHKKAPYLYPINQILTFEFIFLIDKKNYQKPLIHIKIFFESQFIFENLTFKIYLIKKTMSRLHQS